MLFKHFNIDATHDNIYIYCTWDQLTWLHFYLFSLFISEIDNIVTEVHILHFLPISQNRSSKNQKINYLLMCIVIKGSKKNVAKVCHNLITNIPLLLLFFGTNVLTSTENTYLKHIHATYKLWPCGLVKIEFS